MTQLLPISAIALDLDDTLYPERDFVFSGYHAVSSWVKTIHGIDILASLVGRFLAGERGDLFTPTLLQMGCYQGEEQIKALVEIYRNHAPTLQPFEDVLPTLKTLRHKVRLGLISDGIAAVQRRKLRALGIEGFFDVVLFTDDLGRDHWKPHPQAFRECAKLLGCPTTEMIYVGDNPSKDFIGARAVEIFTIRLRRPNTLHEYLEPEPGFEADLEVSNLTDVVRNVIKRLKLGKLLR